VGDFLGCRWLWVSVPRWVTQSAYWLGGGMALHSDIGWHEWAFCTQYAHRSHLVFSTGCHTTPSSFLLASGLCHPPALQAYIYALFSCCNTTWHHNPEDQTLLLSSTSYQLTHNVILCSWYDYVRTGILNILKTLLLSFTDCHYHVHSVNIYIWYDFVRMEIPFLNHSYCVTHIITIIHCETL
jgi:hypothetical protein